MSVLYNCVITHRSLLTICVLTKLINCSCNKRRLVKSAMLLFYCFASAFKYQVRIHRITTVMWSRFRNRHSSRDISEEM